MDATAPWRLGHRPQLDVVRALAVLLVVAAHARLLGDAAGGVGVTMFFALSGFLITSLLLDEQARHGRVRLGPFFVRRARRLLPALLLFLACIAVLAAVADAPTLPSPRDFLGTLLYVGNYVTGMQGRDNVLLHTWSLSVEEQFYLVWPCLVALAAWGTRRHVRALIVLAVTASVAAIALRVVLWDDGRGVLRVYFGTDTRMDGVLLGCLAALWMHGRPVGRQRPWAGLALLAAAAGLALVRDPWFSVVVSPGLVAALTAGAVLCLVQGPATGLFGLRSLQVVGRRSYALYLWHFPLIGSAASLSGDARWWGLGAAVALTAGIVHLSWRCVEEPFLRPRPAGGATAGSRAGVAAATPAV